MTRLEIESDIVEIGGTKRRTRYLKLPKNLIELFELKTGRVQLEVSLRSDGGAMLPRKRVVFIVDQEE